MISSIAMAASRLSNSLALTCSFDMIQKELRKMKMLRNNVMRTIQLTADCNAIAELLGLSCDLEKSGKNTSSNYTRYFFKFWHALTVVMYSSVHFITVKIYSYVYRCALVKSVRYQENTCKLNPLRSSWMSE